MSRYTSIFIFLLITAFPVFSAGEGTREIPEAPDTAVDFPVTRVTLYTAGLAQMVCETTVFNSETINFPVDPGDINDILKSLVVEDLDGGIINAVNFSSTDPLSVTLENLRINPEGSPAMIKFLKRAQGESVTLTTDKGVFSGRIFSIENVQNENKVRRILNIISSKELEVVDITELESLKFNDPKLQRELESALKTIAQSRVKSTRKLKISCKGQGKRRIRLSYIKAVPLWKTSYRIVITKGGTPRLEGWALVQNTSSQRWDNVKLSFVAGQPNAFTMDLATPKYVTRKSMDIITSVPLALKPYTEAYKEAPSMDSKTAARMQAYRGTSGSSINDYAEEEPYTPAPVVSQAKGARSGNFYRYDVKLPVTVDARSSAMIPIISEEEAGQSLAVYDPEYNRVFKGIRLSNNTAAHWAAGPATVLEGRYYGGDTIIPDMIPGSSRILTYAVHGTLEIQKSQNVKPRRITSLKITKGILYRTEKIVRNTEYHIKGKAKELLLIYPKESGWKLTEKPGSFEQTNSEYRFIIKEMEKPVSITEEYTVSNRYSLVDFNSDDIAVYLEWEGASTKIKKALEKAVSLKKDVSSIQSDIKMLTTRIRSISQDQGRIRENMKVLDRKSNLYLQYSSRLGAQEDELQRINKQIENKRDQLKSASKAFEDYVSSLDL